jgi:hypothetical protein
MSTVPVRCARATSWNCLGAVRVPADELQGDGDGDPALLPVLIAPDHWIDDPDGDGVVCEACATPDELEADREAHGRAESALAEQLEREEGRLPVSEEEREASRVFGVELRDPDDYGSLA